MARRIAETTLNASTIDILNVIRQNASYEYQQSVPVVESAHDIPKVGEVIYGTPAIANQFLNALVNRIALVRVQSVTFLNPFGNLKKGYLEFGETIEDIFVSIAKVVDYSAEKASAREFQRSIPDVKSAFHVINWRTMYPVTIQDTELQRAFMSIDGVQNLIAKIVDSVYKGAEYDEYLLFKYLLIKAVSHGKMKPVAVTADDTKDAAVKFRAYSNRLLTPNRAYNEAGVLNNTDRLNQCIFMDSDFNAQFDVDVLSAAFNMEKAEFMGNRFLIDDWAEFDNDRFGVIRENSDGLEEVTSAELELMKKVKAVLVDSEWFQVYDNMNKFTEKYVASGLYWNYFYHTWKTISQSPFANAIVFVADDAVITDPASVVATITGKEQKDDTTVITLSFAEPTSLAQSSMNLVQTEALVTAGVGVIPVGALLIPKSAKTASITLEGAIGSTKYKANTAITAASAVGATVTMTKQ